MANLKVYYGFSKLTKVCKKRELAIYFENEWGYKNEGWLARRMVIAAKRNQTKEEMEFVHENNRVFTKYSIFFDEKPFKGDIKKALDFNRISDINHVSEEELNSIYESCMKLYKQLYPKTYDYRVVQLELDL